MISKICTKIWKILKYFLSLINNSQNFWRKTISLNSNHIEVVLNLRNELVRQLKSRENFAIVIFRRFADPKVTFRRQLLEISWNNAIFEKHINVVRDSGPQYK